MADMSYKTAKQHEKLNQGQKKVVPIETIEKIAKNKKQEIQRLQKEVSRVNQNRSRLNRAKNYLEQYEKSQKIIDKYENNPYLKGKMLVSK
jgi:hypothetical protein